MSTYANVRIHNHGFCVTHDGVPENILEELREYVRQARQMAKPGHIPEVTIALIAADTDDYYSFFQRGYVDPSFGEAYDVEIGPRGGLKIHKRR